MRILALDHGSVRCGCALSDPTGTIARPLDPISPPDPTAVARLVGTHGVERVLVGLPVSLDGTEGEQAEQARAFAAAVEALVDVPVETYDERLTTRMAAATQRGGSRASRDSIAAAHLLDFYLLALEARR